MTSDMLCIWLLTIVVVGVTGNDSVVVKTNYGSVQGEITPQSRRFLGIPYAQPPVGNLRWRYPTRPMPWSPDVYNATVPRPACPQKYCNKFMPRGCPNVTSENCLFLNIWTPLNASSMTSYPVMFWIHGGAFKFGFANSYMYDGNNMAHNGQVIVVTINYRLGLLGYLYTGEGPDDAHGNLGILDQRTALEWVIENIQHFGGDPTKVTIFGQSAGAQSVYAHLMSPISRGMFRAAVVQSAPFGVVYRTKPDALKLADAVAKILHCRLGDMICFRNKTVDEVNDAQEDSLFRLTTDKIAEYVEPFSPVIDGYDIPMQPLDAAAKGIVAEVPLIVGTVTEEGRLFVYGVLNITMPRPVYDAGVFGLHPDHTDEVERRYRVPDNITDYRDALCQMVTDLLFTCSTRNATRNVIMHGERNVYRYVFAHATEGRGGWGRDTFCEGHVCHAEELGFLFENPSPEAGITDEEMKLAASLMNYWTNFAHTMDPNTGPNTVGLKWPLYQTAEESIMYFQTPNNEVTGSYRGDWCDFWDNIGF